MKKKSLYVCAGILSLVLVVSVAHYKINFVNVYAEGNNDIVMSDFNDNLDAYIYADDTDTKVSKDVIFDKMLNTVDYFSSASGKLVTNLELVHIKLLQIDNKYVIINI